MLSKSFFSMHDIVLSIRRHFYFQTFVVCFTIFLSKLLIGHHLDSKAFLESFNFFIKRVLFIFGCYDILNILEHINGAMDVYFFEFIELFRLNLKSLRSFMKSKEFFFSELSQYWIMEAEGPHYFPTVIPSRTTDSASFFHALL